MDRRPKGSVIRPNPILLLLLVDALVVACSLFAAAFTVHFSGPQSLVSVVVGFIPRSAFLVACAVLGLASMGLYRARQRPRLWEAVARIVLGVAIGGAFHVLISYLLPPLTIGRSVLALAMVVSVVGLSAARWLTLRFVDNNGLKKRVVVIGCGRHAFSIHRLRRQADRRQFDIVGYAAISEKDRGHGEALGLEPLLELRELEQRDDIDELVVALDERRGHLPLDFLLAEKFRGVVVTDVVQFLENVTGRMDLDLMRPGWLIFGDSGHIGSFYNRIKRILDVLIASALLFLVLPLLVIVYIAIKLEDGIRAPVLYHQDRVGLNHTVFSLLKFRSMRAGRRNQVRCAMVIWAWRRSSDEGWSSFAPLAN